MLRMTPHVLAYVARVYVQVGIYVCMSVFENSRSRTGSYVGRENIAGGTSVAANFVFASTNSPVDRYPRAET